MSRDTGDRAITRGSMKLSWLLRAGPRLPWGASGMRQRRVGARETGLGLDAAGWVERGELLQAADLSEEQLDEIVRLNNKQRFQVDSSRVRACQGHGTEGTPVTCDALEASWEVYTGDDTMLGWRPGRRRRVSGRRSCGRRWG